MATVPGRNAAVRSDRGHRYPTTQNDHVLDPDGKHIYLSAYDGQIYRAEVLGGVAELVTKEPPADGLLHYLHGVDPSGNRLAFIGIQVGTGKLVGASRRLHHVGNGGDYRQLTSGPGPSDGCEYTPDGEWLYFNTEMFDGHAQIAPCAGRRKRSRAIDL